MPTTAESSSPRLLILKGNAWTTIDAERWGDVFNPSTGEVIARVPFCTAEQVSAVATEAAAALEPWSATPIVERARLMFRFRELLERHFDELAALVTREHGKTLAESRAEVNRGIEVVEFACGIPSLLMGDLLPNIARDVDAEAVRLPVGVCAGITPYNFPLMVPLWMFPIALVCGNPFILKPSEKVPLAANRLGELLLEAGAPPGVLNIVHGDRECVEALLAAPEVGAISFVGSTSAARAIYQRGTALGKRVQAAGGAKNHLIIMPDADIDQAISAVSASAFGCAGQRCMAGSVAVAVGGAGDALTDGLVERARQIRVGPSDGCEEVDMGPVIRAEHRDRVATYLNVAASEGARVALDGRQIKPPGDGFFIGPSIVEDVTPAMRLGREEIFGPVLSVMRAGDLEEALAIGQRCEYGNGAAIFTRDGYAARRFKSGFNAGMIGINVGVPAPMAWFPFTGWNQSFFGDLHIQGNEAIQFYTRQKVTLTRWTPPADAADDPVWRGARP